VPERLNERSKSDDLSDGSEELAYLLGVYAATKHSPSGHPTVFRIGERAAFLRGFLEKAGSVRATRGRHPMLTVRKSLAFDPRRNHILGIRIVLLFSPVSLRTRR